jgi:DNA-binding FrmR family transcriptional regulator
MSSRRAVTPETDQAAALEKRLQHRLRRAEGQVRAVQRMLDESRPCEEIVTQLLAARSALDQVMREILSNRVAECVATLPPEQAQAAVSRAVGLLVRA